MQSQKKGVRLGMSLLVGLVIIMLSVVLDPEQAKGWLMTTLMSVGKASLGAGMFYWVLRGFLHTRTHELKTETDRNLWQMVLMVAVAIVFGCGLIA